MMYQQSLFLLALVAFTANAFVPVQQQHNVRSTCTSSSLNGIFDKMGDKMSEMMEELDAFVDDATSRRLGAGAAFYGKRKSKFYGEEDTGRKSNKNVADPTEDYQGPTSTGLFEWMQDEDGQMRPVTRGKNLNIERNPNFWDKVYDKEAKKEEASRKK